MAKWWRGRRIDGPEYEKAMYPRSTRPGLVPAKRRQRPSIFRLPKVVARRVLGPILAIIVLGAVTALVLLLVTRTPGSDPTQAPSNPIPVASVPTATPVPAGTLVPTVAAERVVSIPASPPFLEGTRPETPNPTATLGVTLTPQPALKVAPTPGPAPEPTQVVPTTVRAEITNVSFTATGYTLYLEVDSLPGAGSYVWLPVRTTTSGGIITESTTQFIKTASGYYFGAVILRHDLVKNADLAWVRQNIIVEVVFEPDTVLPRPTPVPTAWPALTSTPPPPTLTPAPSPVPTSVIQEYMLHLINADRAKAGLRPVALGSNTAAQQHADDMLKNFYIGHIDSGGMKPYMRYTLAGGFGAVGENAGYSGTQDPSDRRRYATLDPKEMLQRLQHDMVYDDAASNWGHRDNILEAQHQFVNIGIAYDRTRLALSQQFEERYVNFSQPPKLANGILTLAGSLDPSVGRLQSIDIYYDPPPSPYTPGQLLAQPASYSVGTSNRPAIHIIAPAPPGSFYVDLPPTTVVATSWAETGNAFQVTASAASKVTQPGVYTLLLWTDQGKFPLTTISLFVP